MDTILQLHVIMQCEQKFDEFSIAKTKLCMKTCIQINLKIVGELWFHIPVLEHNLVWWSIMLFSNNLTFILKITFTYSMSKSENCAEIKSFMSKYLQIGILGRIFCKI